MRDDFSQVAKDRLARRVNYLCSNPDCPLATVGPHSDPEKAVNRGVAAHITAAAQGGKRYDALQTPKQRRSVSNGIWLCQNCAKLIDSDEDRYTVDLLQAWKRVSESKVECSIRSNSPLNYTQSGHQLRVRGSYWGGKHGTCVTIYGFNSGVNPIYLSSWYAEWSDNCARSSMNCERGELPFRLQSQETHRLLIDLGERGFEDLKRIGLVDGSGQLYFVGDTDTAIMVQEAKRHSVLYPTTNNSALELQLQVCDVDVRAEIETASNLSKSLVVSFINNSDIAIPLIGSRIEWKYDPPRKQPRGSDATGPVSEVQKISGSVNLACRTDLSIPVPPHATVRFYLPPEIAVVLLETILGDVKDSDIVISFGTSTQFGWEAKDDVIPSTIREYANHIAASRQYGR